MAAYEELEVVLPKIVGDPGPSSGWESEPIFTPVASATAGIWRYRGDGWSVVLKLLHHSDVGSPMWLSGEDEAHWFYWQREALAFESGLLDSLTRSLRAPRCHGVFRRGDGTVALWLEDLAGTVLIDWAFIGVGAVGEDIGNLLVDAVWDFHVPASDLDALEAALVSGYLQGLRDGGLEHDADTVRLAILASASVKYLWILPAVLAAVRSEQSEINHRPAAETIPPGRRPGRRVL